MANHISHASLPYPIKGARYTIAVPYLDADGDPTDPTTPDTEVSIDGAAFADCAEEVSTITGSNGAGYLTLSGAETNCSLVFVCAKVASGPKATLAMLNPRVLPVLLSGTASAGAAGTITLAAGGIFLRGCIVRTTGGTGGGGTGGANNQARMITGYVISTKVATVSPNWETAPDNTTTYEILLTDIAVNAVMTSVYEELRADHTIANSFGDQSTDSEVAIAVRTEMDNNSSLLGTIAADAASISDAVSVSGVTVAEANRPGIRKNIALTRFEFVMTVTVAGVSAPTAGLTVAVTRSIDGAAFAAGTLSAVTPVGSGVYYVDFAAADLNGNVVTLRATSPGADDTLVTLKTSP